jgi:hypothetical protein
MYAETAEVSRISRNSGRRGIASQRRTSNRDESFGQPSVEQETADALESRASALSASGSRRIAQRNFTRRLSNSEPSISRTFWIQLCSLGLLAPPHTFHSQA